MSFNPVASFAGRRVPPWLLRFAEEPQTALHDLLMGRAALGHLDAAEPGEVLLDWLRLLKADFSTTVDTALAGWIDSHWGDSFPDGSAGHAALTAEAWMRACDLIALEPCLQLAAAALRGHVLAQPRFLESIGEGRARDPQSRAWQALARHQTDRSLLPQWWNLCRLPPDQPWRRGACGIDGLLFLPAENARHNGGFPQAAAEGLACLGAALWQRQQDGWLSAETARDEWLSVAHLAELAAPFPDRWLDFWRGAQAEPRCLDWVKWIRHLHHNLRTPKPRAAFHQPDPTWPDQAKDLVSRIEIGDINAVSEAEVLLQDERRYAVASGDSNPYVLSAVKLSSAARHRRDWLLQALAWADSARELAPWEPYPWNMTVTCLRQLNRPDALIMAMEAAQRFPDDPSSCCNLAEVLSAQRRLEEAESQYRQILERFPDNVLTINGLARVLTRRYKFTEAEQVYQKALEYDQTNETTQEGYRELKRLIARPELRASQIEKARKVLDASPNNVDALCGLAKVLRRQNQFEEALGLVEQALQIFPSCPEALDLKKKLSILPAVDAETSQLDLKTEQLSLISHEEIQILTADAYTSHGAVFGF